MRTVYLFLVAVLRVSAWALVGCIDAIRTVLGYWADVHSDYHDDGMAYFWTGYGDDGFDQFGGTLTPGEEGSSLVKRKRFL
jgi:hypothetical protein